ncbi:MAG TPA: hypothetical protein VJ020_13360 [Anaerolineales bacterium]|nr:hypothetical protein [Anaerolineales bacterium]
MNANLEQPNFETLSAISREHQAEMRREAQIANALGRQAGGGYAAKVLQKLVVALCVLVPIVLWTARAVSAAGAGGGGGGFIHVMM